jgi:mutual gliding-motility protein MglA
LDEIPYVLQYNKRDLPDAVPLSYLEFLLNNRRRRARSYEAIATKGRSVFAALDAVTQSVLNKFIQENHLLRPKPATESVVQRA